MPDGVADLVASVHTRCTLFFRVAAWRVHWTGVAFLTNPVRRQQTRSFPVVSRPAWQSCDTPPYRVYRPSPPGSLHAIPASMPVVPNGPRFSGPHPGDPLDVLQVQADAMRARKLRSSDTAAELAATHRDHENRSELRFLDSHAAQYLHRRPDLAA